MALRLIYGRGPPKGQWAAQQVDSSPWSHSDRSSGCELWVPRWIQRVLRFIRRQTRTLFARVRPQRRLVTFSNRVCVFVLLLVCFRFVLSVCFEQTSKTKRDPHRLCCFPFSISVCQCAAFCFVSPFVFRFVFPDYCLMQSVCVGMPSSADAMFRLSVCFARF